MPLGFETTPTGAELAFVDMLAASPVTVTSWAGYGFDVVVPLQTDPAGQRWGFEAWGDDGALTATRWITTPGVATTYPALLGITVTAPLPTLVAVSPPAALQYGPGLTLTLVGVNFSSDAVVRFEVSWCLRVSSAARWCWANWGASI